MRSSEWSSREEKYFGELDAAGRIQLKWILKKNSVCARFARQDIGAGLVKMEMQYGFQEDGRYFDGQTNVS
jgi:hypothetical protein